MSEGVGYNIFRIVLFLVILITILVHCPLLISHGLTFDEKQKETLYRDTGIT